MRVLYNCKILLFTLLYFAQQCKSQSQNQVIDVEAVYTDSQIVGAGQPSESCSEKVLESRRNVSKNGGPIIGVEPTVSLSVAIVIFLMVGLLAAAIAFVFHTVRRKVYNDADNLDTAFDAGGKVSIGLTATTIVSQWTWAATLLQSSTVASRFGLSGPYWYAAGATIQIILFAILSIMLKTRAPGAKTFLQVIRARFGKNTHIVYCCFAFFTNLVVTMMLLLGGTAVLTSLVKDLSPELASMLLALVIGGYTLIGGLGATFYVSYFNTSFIFILILMLIVEVFYNPYQHPNNPFGSSSSIYAFTSCWKAPEGNAEQSYMTFFSSGGLIFGIINIVGNFGAVFCDQAYWQSSVAAKPIQGVWGFVSGGLTWFAIPFAMATTMGLAYLGLSSASGSPLLTDEDVSRGLAAPLVAQRLLGTTGEYCMIFLMLMAVMSTGSAEIIAVASILIYDIYQTYLQPFRPDLQEGHCVVCGKLANTKPCSTHCRCPSVHKCHYCHVDNDRRSKVKGLVKPALTCAVHSEYRQYQEQLLNYKNWCIVICTFLTVPLVLFGWAININLAWTYYFMGVLISSSVVPISLALTWARANSKGMISGVIVGCICGIVSWLAFASQYEGGLSAETFIDNSGKDFPMLTGNLISIVVGGLVTLVVSLVTRPKMTQEEIDAEWEKSRNIDNPLSPWVQVYKHDLDLEDVFYFHDRPSLEVIAQKFKKAKITAIVAGISFAVLFVLIWPAAMLSSDVISEYGFGVWTTFSRGWAFIAAAFIIVVPLVQEIVAVRHHYLATLTEQTSIKDENDFHMAPDANTAYFNNAMDTNEV